MSDAAESNEAAAAEGAGAEVDAFIEGAAGLFGSLRDIFEKSREEVVRGARLGKVRIDVFQLRKDREHQLLKLGERAFELMVAGQLEPGDLQEPYAALTDIDRQIGEYEAEIAGLSDEPAEDAPAAAAPAAEPPPAAEPEAPAAEPEPPAVEAAPAAAADPEPPVEAAPRPGKAGPKATKAAARKPASKRKTGSRKASTTKRTSGTRKRTTKKKSAAVEPIADA